MDGLSEATYRMMREDYPGMPEGFLREALIAWQDERERESLSTDEDWKLLYKEMG